MHSGSGQGGTSRCWTGSDGRYHTWPRRRRGPVRRNPRKREVRKPNDSRLRLGRSLHSPGEGGINSRVDASARDWIPAGQMTSTRGSRARYMGRNWHCGDPDARPIRNHRGAELVVRPRYCGSEEGGPHRGERAESWGSGRLPGCIPDRESCFEKYDRWNVKYGSNSALSHIPREVTLPPERTAATRSDEKWGTTSEHSQTVTESATVAECSNPSEQGSPHGDQNNDSIVPS